MSAIINAAWAIPALLKYAGAAVGIAGVAYFGWHFIRANAQAARDAVNVNTAVVWGGAGAKLGLKIVGLALTMEFGAFLLANVLPDRL